MRISEPVISAEDTVASQLRYLLSMPNTDLQHMIGRHNFRSEFGNRFLLGNTP